MPKVANYNVPRKAFDGVDCVVEAFQAEFDKIGLIRGQTMRAPLQVAGVVWTGKERSWIRVSREMPTSLDPRPRTSSWERGETNEHILPAKLSFRDKQCVQLV